MRGVAFGAARLVSVDMSEADLSGADLSRCGLADDPTMGTCVWRGCTLTGARLPRNLRGLDLTGCRFGPVSGGAKPGAQSVAAVAVLMAATTTVAKVARRWVRWAPCLCPQLHWCRCV